MIFQTVYQWYETKPPALHSLFLRNSLKNFSRMMSGKGTQAIGADAFFYNIWDQEA